MYLKGHFAVKKSGIEQKKCPENCFQGTLNKKCRMEPENYLTNTIFLVAIRSLSTIKE
jgi:hypothetical protein